jgi:hypothetical protein
MLRERHIELPPLDSLPQQVCTACHKSKIRGLFTPEQLQMNYPRCRKCIGDLNTKNRKGID